MAAVLSVAAPLYSAEEVRAVREKEEKVQAEVRTQACCCHSNSACDTPLICSISGSLSL